MPRDIEIGGLNLGPATPENLLALANFAGLIHTRPGPVPPGFHPLLPFGIGDVSVPGPFTLLGNIHDTLLSATGVDVRIPTPIPGLPKPFIVGRPGGFSVTYTDFQSLLAEFGIGDRESAPISELQEGNGMIAITMAFSQQNGSKHSGWSESYQTSDTSLASANVLMARYSGFIDARLNMLGAGVTCVAVRFTDLPVGVPPLVPTSRSVVVASGPPPSIGGIGGAVYYNSFLKIFPTDFSGTKAIIRMSSVLTNGVVYRRSVWVGGLPDDFDSPLRTTMNPGPWTIAAAIFFNRFTPGFTPSFVKMRTIDRSAAFPQIPVTAVDVTGLIYTLTAHGFADGQVVNVSGFKASKGGCRPSGEYRVHVLDLNTVTLRNAVASARLTALGSFRKVNYLVLTCASISDYTFTQRKSGRPSDLSRGKSPKRQAIRA